MRLLARTLWCCCLFLAKALASAADSNPAGIPSVPAPPQQAAPWMLSFTSSITNLQSTVEVLFRNGMADPRGCEYREIEVVVGNLAKAAGVSLKTRGWVLPAAGGSPARYAIGWNGLIYPLVSIGEPANAEYDARTMIQGFKNNELRHQTWTDEEYALGTQWLTPTKAALILRFAPTGLAGECAQCFGREDPFLLLATDHLWTAFDRAICAHMRGDDDLAYAMTLVLTRAKPVLEAEARARGCTTLQAPEAEFRRRSGTPPESYFPFLDSVPALLHDQERRHQRRSPLRDPAKADVKADRIAALVDQLENVSARQARNALDRDLIGDLTVRALIREGWEAVEPLLLCYEHDDRLTRIVPDTRNWNGSWRSRADREIVGVRSPAYAALEAILETRQFAPGFTSKETQEEQAAVYKRTAVAMHDYWNRYKALSREERLYAILKDDQGRWPEAASILVQATNQPIVTFISWDPTPWQSPLSLYDVTPMRGEGLRSKSNPSVAELLSKRIHTLVSRGANQEDDAAALNEACDLALCLAKWDRKAALPEFQRLSALSFQKLDPTNHTSLVSHMYLSGQLPALITFRVRAGDTNALIDYARWLVSINPAQFSWQPRQILDPLRQFPASAGWGGTWKSLFEDEQSPWFQFFQKTSSPDPQRMSSPGFSIEEFFGTPIINNDSFRKFVIRVLHDRSVCGKIAGGTGGYWLDQQLSTDRLYGYTMQPPPGTPNVAGRSFRTCDFYAWLLSNRIEGAPAFQLFWPDDQKDTALAVLEKMLTDNKSRLQTRPFQEP
jgi:hypothetical protein